MKFFTAKNVGMTFMILAVAEVIVAPLMVILAWELTAEGYNIFAYTIAPIGVLIASCLYFMLGKKVKDGVITQKIDILTQYVKIAGIVNIAVGICYLVGELFLARAAHMAIQHFEEPIILIVFGLIIFFIARKINDEKQTTGDKVIWIVLLVIFVLLIIAAIGEISVIPTLPLGICDLFIAVFMLTLLVNPEVKSEMNM